MSGFELTAFGPVPLGTPYLDPAKVTPEEAAKYVVQHDYGHGDQGKGPSQPQLKKRASAPVAQPQPVASTTSGGVIASARARVKELRAEIRRMKALQKELAELERLLKAAKQKPTASVRPLRSVG